MDKTSLITLIAMMIYKDRHFDMEESIEVACEFYDAVETRLKSVEPEAPNEIHKVPKNPLPLKDSQ